MEVDGRLTFLPGFPPRWIPAWSKPSPCWFQPAHRAGWNDEPWQSMPPCHKTTWREREEHITKKWTHQYAIILYIVAGSPLRCTPISIGFYLPMVPFIIWLPYNHLHVHFSNLPIKVLVAKWYIIIRMHMCHQHQESHKEEVKYSSLLYSLLASLQMYSGTMAYHYQYLASTSVDTRPGTSLRISTPKLT